MKIRVLISIILGVLFTLQSFDKQGNEPYIIFKDSNAKVINIDTIEVESASVQELLIETGFNSLSPRYLQQIFLT
ncbi:MAG: hypothetical protein CSA36_00320 [Draconibacterium sp.]|nr:MAG: hypothetical protein CSA36_00320 [Draconibacterium sp.]